MYKALTSLVLLFLPIVGGMAVARTGGKVDKKWMRSLNQADTTPPEDWFPVIWSFLYIFLGLNAVLLYLNLGDEIFWEGYYTFYFAQLLLNYAWSIAFFKYRNPSLALLILTLMIVLTIAMTYLSYKVNAFAFILMLSYLLWLFFAYYLNIYIVQNN